VPAPLGGSWQVLYAEDDPVNALLMQAVLERLPAVTLHVAATGAAARRLAESQVPDLLLLDMSLPDMDGRELLAHLRADPRLAAVPAVAVSADAMPDEIRRTLAAGFDAYWTKPLDIDHLPAALQALLSHRHPSA
jgi:CheY-like chemotaxis protein